MVLDVPSLTRKVQPMLASLAAAPAKVDFVSPWNTAWGAISSAAPGFFRFVAVIGVLLVVAGFIGYLWARRKGGNGNVQGFLITVGIGAVLCAPSVIVPVILYILGLLADLVVGFLNIGKK